MVGEHLARQHGGRAPTDAEVLRLVESLAEQHRSLRTQVGSYLEEIWRSSRKVWSQAYGRRARQSAWEKDNVRVFICGGAAHLPGVSEIFAKSWYGGVGGANWGPYPVAELGKPPDYFDPGNKAPFFRMSVAYGLAQPIPDLGDFGPGGDHVLPRDCPDNTPPRPRELHWDIRSESDQMYPDLRW